MADGTKLSMRRAHTGDRVLDTIQGEAERAQRRLNDCPFVAGRRVEGVAFAANTAKTIDHGLGRAPRGVIVIRSYGANAAPPPVESSTQPPNRSLQIKLQTTADATFDLWFW